MKDTVKLSCLDCGQTNRVRADRLAAAPRCGTCGTPLLAPKPREGDMRSLASAIAADGLPLLVDFWAPWCGPCRSMAPEFARAAQALHPEVRSLKIDTEAHPEASRRFGIRGIPLLILFEGGREVARLAGARPAREIEAFVRERRERPVRAPAGRHHGAA